MKVCAQYSLELSLSLYVFCFEQKLEYRHTDTQRGCLDGNEFNPVSIETKRIGLGSCLWHTCSKSVSKARAKYKSKKEANV